jgi:hypothetical protein
MVVHASDGLEGGKHTERAVEAAAVGHGVEVAPGQDRVRRGIRALAAGEHVPHFIHAHREPGLSRPEGEKIARLAVGVAQGEAVHPAARGGADAGHLLHGFPKAGGVDLQGGS